MPNPTEVATIVINGQQFSTWKTVSVERSHDELGSIGDVSLIESTATDASDGDPSAVAAGSSSRAMAAVQGIVVGSPAQIQLGGIQVLDGFVAMRQAVLTAEGHGVIIRIASHTILTVNSSVSTSPGQFKNFTMSSLANSILSPLGLQFMYGPGGAPDGAENPFPRVSLNVGESVFDALSRLVRMRNLYIRDDENSNVVAIRVTGSESAVAQLTEGQAPFKSGNAILRNDTVLSAYSLTGQNYGSDQVNGDNARAVSASATSSDGQPGTSKVVTMPMAGASSDAALHLGRVIAEDRTKALDISITVQGWFADSSNLWIALIGQKITLVSPTLLPASFDQAQTPLFIRGVTHKQNDATGTETEIRICDHNSLGAAFSLDGGTTPPAPDAPDAPAPTGVGHN